MSPTEIWLTIAGITASTLLTRAGLLVTEMPVRLPPKVQAALRYAPVCALTGIIVPDLMISDGAVLLAWSNVRLIAACAAVVIFLVTRSVLGTIAGGMGVFWLLRAFAGGGA